MSLQCGKKRVKRSGEREVDSNMYKFMKTESEFGLSKVQKRFVEATRVSRRTLCRVLKEGEYVGTGVAMAFSTPRKLRPNVCTKTIYIVRSAKARASVLKIAAVFLSLCRQMPNVRRLLPRRFSEFNIHISWLFHDLIWSVIVITYLRVRIGKNIECFNYNN